MHLTPPTPTGGTSGAMQTAICGR